jgi:ketosteroid isomerase-like protein
MASRNVETAERIYAARLRGISMRSWRSSTRMSRVRDYLASLDEEWDDFRQEVEEAFDAGDRVVVFLNTHGRGRSSGVELHLQVAHVLCFKDGKCVENETYLDRDEALRAAGLPRR